jgi:manganese/zinc/iron transport system permease protein
MDFLRTAGFWEVAGVLAATAAACSVLGSFLVLRRMALLTDAIGHVLLLGIVLAFLVTHDLKSPLLILGAAGTGLVTVALVEAVSKSRLVKEDAAIGLVFPALFALGVILTTLYTRNVHLDVDRVLLGSPELAPLNRFTWGDEAGPGSDGHVHQSEPRAGAKGASAATVYDLGPVSLVIMSVVFVLNAVFVAVLFKELKLSTFDAALAASLGFVPAAIHYALMGLVSLTAVTAFDAAGPVLVVAFFVVPPATAYLLTDRLSVMVLVGVAIAVAGAVLGTAAAYRLGVTVSGTVAVVMGVMFVAVLAGSPRHGIIVLIRRRARQRREFFEIMLAIHLHHHEGTPVEEEESRLVTLHRHMNWPEEQARAVARRLIARGWAAERADRLALTPAGRDAAVMAVGRRPATSDKSVS